MKSISKTAATETLAAACRRGQSTVDSPSRRYVGDAAYPRTAKK